jgi:hypothetical protein
MGDENSGIHCAHARKGGVNEMDRNQSCRAIFGWTYWVFDGAFIV